MSKPFDTILKQLLDNYAADWVQWLGPRLNLPPGPIVAIDPQLATIQPMADKVFRLPDGASLCTSSWRKSRPRLTFQTGWVSMTLRQKAGIPA